MIYAPTYKLENSFLSDIRDGTYLLTYLSVKMTQKGTPVPYLDVKDDEQYKRIICPSYLFEKFEEIHYNPVSMEKIKSNKMSVIIEKGYIKKFICQKRS